MNQIPKLNPWVARPLTEASKNRHFRAVMDLQAERVILGRSAVVAGWVIGGIGVACMALSIWGWVEILPLKETKFVFEEVDKSTGIVGEPVGIQDAPKLFGAAVEQQYLRQYVMAREAWVPQMDQENDHVAKLMSSPEEQARIAEARKSPSGNPIAVGKDGFVQIQNFRFHPLAVGKDGETRRYIVQFDRTVWHGSAKDATQSWSAVIDFSFHPAMPMPLPSDRAINAAGMVVQDYSATSDTPAPKRQ
jgi:type IV secretory pathway component VirB8